MEYLLEDLFDLQMGKTPSRKNPDYWNSNDNKWISIGDISRCGKYISDTKEYISNRAVSDSGISLIPENTVIMSFKLSIGKTAITLEPMYSNEAIMSFKDKHIVELLPDYIYYMFLAKNWNEGSNKAVKGTTLNKATLSKIRIKVHNINEQIIIAKTLDKLQSIINHRKQQLLKLDELVKARFVEMFGEPVSNTMNWDTVPLGKLTTKIGSGATPKGGRETYGTEGISLIRSMNVHNGYFEYKDLAYISDEQAKKLDNVIVHDKDVLLNITGASVARCCIVPDNILPARVNQHVCIIRCKADVSSIFLCSVLTDDNFQNLLWNIAGSGATREAITKQQVESLSIIVPPIALQQQFATFVAQIDKSKVVVQKALDEAQLLFDSLMQECFG